MAIIDCGGVAINVRVSGPDDGLPVVLLHALGTDLRLWDGLVPMLPASWRIARLDLRGHGGSAVPPAPYGMGALVRDVEQAMEALDMRAAVVVGVSLGGLVAQGLAVKRADLVRALVLSNTAAKIGTAQAWAERIALVETQGVAAIVPATIERWFAPAFRTTPEAQLWARRLAQTPVEGYLGCAAAISGADFYTPTAGLRMPVMTIAGDRDGSTPPDLVRETANLVPGAEFRLIRASGHLPCVDAPRAMAEALGDFVGGLLPQKI